MKKYLS